MNETMITNFDETTSKCYAVYYKSQGRYYVIYTERNKDEKGYVVLHLAKVLKVVNSSEDGEVVPTGKYVGMDVENATEWADVKNDIQNVVAYLQGNGPETVEFLPVDSIKGIFIKSSKTFRLTEEIVNLIVKETEEVAPVEPAFIPVDAPAEVEPEVAPVEEEVSPFIPVEPEIETPVEVETPIEPEIPAMPEIPAIPSLNDDIPMPAMAPNPFEFQPLPTIDVNPEPIEEEKPINPYEELQKQRDEEMIKNLANDNMQDIAPVSVLSVDDLEKTREFVIPTETEETAPVEVEITPADVEKEEIKEEVPAVEENKEETPVEVEQTSVEVKPAEDANSFVDSIVADVSDILDKKEEDDDADYKQLYQDSLEKTIELEKELKELHNKLNNIKNIVE